MLRRLMAGMGGRTEWRWSCLDTSLSLDGIIGSSLQRQQGHFFGLILAKAKKGEEVMMTKKHEERCILTKSVLSCNHIGI